MAFKDVKRQGETTIVKVYGFGESKKIKLVRMRSVRTSGLETEDDICRGLNDVKLDESIIRAKNRIFELAYCNPWDFFFTGTLDKSKYDRSDLDKFHKDFTQWLRDQGRRLGVKIDFLLVPELHSDGVSWHMHGFIRGLPQSELKQFVIGDKMSTYLANKVRAGEEIYNWVRYQKKFGFCDLEPIKNHEAVSKYVTKYINKGLANCVRDINAHVYYHSRGLKSAELVAQGTALFGSDTFKIDFEGEFASISWLPYEVTLVEALKDSVISLDPRERFANYEYF